MSISQIGDIVMDVARAADPARIREAAAALEAGRPPGLTARAVAGAGDPSAGIPRPARSFDSYGIRTVMRTDSRQVSAMPSSPCQQLEALVLQTVVETMMPQDADSVFGKGLAGSVWKSLMAEQVGAQLARSGGVGLSATLERALKPAAKA